MASSRESFESITAREGAKTKSQCFTVKMQTLAHRSFAILFEQYLAQSRSPSELLEQHCVAARTPSR